MRVARAEIVASMSFSPRPFVARREGLLLRLWDEEGRQGQGEASPLPGYSPDTALSCRQALLAMPWKTIVIDPLAPLEAELRGPLAAVPPPAARFAVETALVDLVGQTLRRPVSSLWNRDRSGDVALSLLLDAQTPAEIVAQGRRALALGVRTFKVKIGERGAFARELALLRALRDALGGAFSLRLDANGRLDVNEAPACLEALDRLAPEFLEEPVPPPFLDTLSGSPVPLALDESLQRGDHDWLAGLIERRIAKVLVLKPMALGGAVACLELARLAEAAHLGVVVTHLFDGPIALAAAAELALGLPAPPLACGLYRHPGLKTWPDVAIPTVKDSALTWGPHAGLGVPPLDLS